MILLQHSPLVFLGCKEFAGLMRPIATCAICAAFADLESHTKLKPKIMGNFLRNK